MIDKIMTGSRINLNNKKLNKGKIAFRDILVVLYDKMTMTIIGLTDILTSNRVLDGTVSQLIIKNQT